MLSVQIWIDFLPADMKRKHSYSRLQNKHKGTLINFWKNLKEKKKKMTAMPRLM